MDYWSSIDTFPILFSPFLDCSSSAVINVIIVTAIVRRRRSAYREDLSSAFNLREAANLLELVFFDDYDDEDFDSFAVREKSRLRLWREYRRPLWTGESFSERLESLVAGKRNAIDNKSKDEFFESEYELSTYYHFFPSSENLAVKPFDEKKRCICPKNGE